MFLEIVFYTLIAGMVGTGLGGVVGGLFKKKTNKLTSLLLSFAGGIMLSIVCFDLLTSSIENSNIFIAVIVTAFSVGVVYLLNLFIDNYSKKRSTHIDECHPKTHDDLDELIHSEGLVEARKAENVKKSLLNAGILMVFVIALHNFPEGLSIGSSYAHSEKTGIILAVIIAIHNIPEGMAISVPLICGGMKRYKAIITTAICGLPTTIGAICGYLLGGISDLGLGISLALASGAMIYVVLGEIFPQSILMYRSKAPAFTAIGGILIGVLLIYVI